MLLFWFISVLSSSLILADPDSNATATECVPPCPTNSTLCALYLGAPTCLVANDTLDQKCSPKCSSPKRCVELPNGAGTECMYGRMLTPKFCEIDPCANGGTCSEKYNMIGISVGFRCDCTPDWVGVICDRPKADACSSNPCMNRCACLASCKHERGYQCVSLNEGFIGKNCDVAVPSVECLKNQIVVNISQAFYQEFDKDVGNSFMFVNPTAGQQEITKSDRCAVSAARDGSYQMKIDLPFVDVCGTTIASDPVAEGIVFENRIWINRDTRMRFDMPVPVIDFSCVYARQYEALASLKPLVEPNVAVIVRTGSFSADIGMCKIPSCPSSCPTLYEVLDEAVYTIGDIIHVKIGVNTEQVSVSEAFLVVTVAELFLSCSPNAWMPGFATMVPEQSGCPQNPGFKFSLRSGQTTSPHSVCLSFQVPKAAKCDLIYLHATLQLCHVDELQQCEQNPNVLYCKLRRKRSSNHTNVITDDVTRTFIGPINIFLGSKGLRYEKLHVDGQPGNVVLFTDKEDVPENQRPSHPQLELERASRVVFVLGICSATISFAVMLFYWFRSRVGAKEPA